MDELVDNIIEHGGMELSIKREKGSNEVATKLYGSGPELCTVLVDVATKVSLKCAFGNKEKAKELLFNIFADASQRLDSEEEQGEEE